MNPLEQIQAPRAPRRGEGPPRGLLVPGLIFTACALAALLSLSLVSTAPGQTSRLRELRDGVARVERASAGQPAAWRYSPGAVCGAHERGVGELRRRLAEEASKARVELSAIDVRSEPAHEASGLTALSFTVESSAQYEALLRYLGALSEAEPTIFVDTVDLTPATSVAILKMKGRVLCWTIARR